MTPAAMPGWATDDYRRMAELGLLTGDAPGFFPTLRNERSCLADGLPIEAICKGIASMAVEVSDVVWYLGEVRVSGYRGTGATKAEATRNAFDDLWEEDRRTPGGLK